jgi:heat shock protein HslJ
VVAALVAGVVAAACAERGGGARFRGRTFLSESVTQDGRPLPLVVGTSIRLTFHDDGRLTASAGCNSMGGPVRTDGGRIAVADLATTEMGCDPERHAQDAWLAGFLTGRPAWRYEAPRLELRAGSTTVVLLDRAVADPDRPVEGTTWGLDGPSTATP